MSYKLFQKVPTVGLEAISSCSVNQLLYEELSEYSLQNMVEAHVRRISNFQELLNRPVDLKKRYTLLHRAAEEGNVVVIRALVALGADMSKMDSKMRSAESIYNKAHGVAGLQWKDLFVKPEVTVEKEIDSLPKYPLEMVLSELYEAHVLWDYHLLRSHKKKFEGSLVDPLTGKSCLHLAAKKHKGSFIRKLIEEGGFSPWQVDRKRKLPVHVAALHGNLSAYYCLTENAEALDRDYRGRTPFHCAAVRGALPILDRIKSIDCVGCDDNGQNLLHILAIQGYPSGIDCIIRYHKNFMNKDLFNQKDLYGRTPLEYGVSHKNLGVVMRLLPYSNAETIEKAKVMAKLGSGPILTDYLENGMLPEPRPVITYEELVEKESRCEAALSCFIAERLSQGADIDRRDERDGLTVLQKAIREQNTVLIGWLVDVGYADHALKDNNGYTPFHDAIAIGYVEGIRLLGRRLQACPKVLRGKESLNDLVFRYKFHINPWDVYKTLPDRAVDKPTIRSILYHELKLIDPEESGCVIS